MAKLLTRQDLYSLEQYAEMRNDYRSKVIAHKKDRVVHLGNHLALHFEDRLTMQYQVQEMLRIEKIFEVDAIEEELAAYNPLIPNGGNLKATMMIEYGDVEQRRIMLEKLIGIEQQLWVEVDGFPRVTPIANEDLERTTEEKTSSVHFLRFELSSDMINALKQGAALSIGASHEFYNEELRPLLDHHAQSLINDLQTSS